MISYQNLSQAEQSYLIVWYYVCAFLQVYAYKPDIIRTENIYQLIWSTSYNTKHYFSSKSSHVQFTKVVLVGLRVHQYDSDLN